MIFLWLAVQLIPSACAVEIPPATPADCYTLSVPENRLKAESPMIHLPVVILRSTNPQKKADPVLFTAGGPGGSTLANMRGRASIPLRRDRDVILFQQRGNRFTTPWLQCPEYNDVQRTSAEKNLDGADVARLQVEAATTCHTRLASQGVDLDAYNTSEIAADIADLRRALDIPNLNLYGISYGALVMLEVMRSHPEGIRSVFIDSVLPPNVSYDEFGNRNVMRALDAVFDGCDVDAACSRAHPDLRRNFTKLVDTLNEHPHSTTLKSADGKSDLPYRVNGRNVVEALEVLLYDASSIGAIPKVIDDASRGDYAALDSALQENIGESGFTWGARIAVWCHDMAPFDDPAAVKREADRFPSWRGHPSATVPPGVCAEWKVSAAPASFAQPVVSSIPTLVYGGEYDPNVPPQWSQLVAQSLDHATFVQFAGQAHPSGETRCGFTILMRFLDDPTKPVDTSCAKNVTHAPFR